MTDASPVEQDTQHQQPRELPSSETLDLQYPQLLLQASFASLLSSSFSSASQSRILPMPASEHSLSESWASLSEADYTPDEDSRSEITGTFSLLGTTPSEGLQSDEEQEDIHEPEEGHDEAPTDSDDPAELPTPIQTSISQLHDAQPYDSTYTIGAPSPNAIKFVEAESRPIGHGRVDLMHSVKVFDEKEKARLAKDIAKVHRAVQLNGTIRMTTSQGSIRRDRPFRLLYGGSPRATETRAEILKKVGDVLVASSSVDMRHNLDASRYHVIPSEFGPGSSPNYAELIPLQFQQMIVDECVSAVAFKQDSAHTQIRLKYKGGQLTLSVWDGAAYRVPRGSGWDPPDLAIIFVSESDDNERQLFSGRLNEFTSRHHIPTLVVRDENDWSASYDYIVPDRRSLHMCVESRTTGILQLLPIDLSSFINLDAGQLNKHIACLCAIYAQDADRQREAPKPKSTQELQQTSGDVEKNLSKSIVAQNRAKAYWVKHEDTIYKALQVSAGIFLLILGFSFCRETLVLLAAYFSGASSMSSIAPSTTALSSQSAASMITTSAIRPTTVAFVSTMGLPNKPSVGGLTATGLEKDLARLVSEAAETYNKSDKFQVQILGDGHVVVKAPQRLLGKKKSPRITVSVMRGSTEVPSNTSKLFEGLYTVKIAREHANGLLNVTIAVKKPAITEAHELDFGQPWIPADKLRDAFDHLWRPIWERVAIFDDHPGVKISNVLANAQGRLQSASASGMGIARNLTTQYGPSLRKLSKAGQSKSQGLYTDAVQHAQAAAQAVGRETYTELQQLRTASRIAGQEASAIAHKFLADVSARISQVRERAGSIDLDQVRDKLIRSEMLADAQERARKMTDGITRKVKSRRELVKAAQAARRKGRAEKKCKKRSDKKPWHSNVRINFGL
jgi:hypothetical protein